MNKRDVARLRKACAGEPIRIRAGDRLLLEGLISARGTSGYVVTPRGREVGATVQVDTVTAPLSNRERQQRRQQGARPVLRGVTVPREVEQAMRARAERDGLGWGEAWEKAARAWLEAQDQAAMS